MVRPGTSKGARPYTDKRTGRRAWRYWFRDKDGNQQLRQGFETKREAEIHWRGVDGKGGLRAEILAGLDVKQGGGPKHLEHYQQLWSQLAPVAPTTKKTGESVYRNHLHPVFGATPVTAISKTRIRQWLQDIDDAGVGDSTRRLALVQLSRALEVAVEEQAVAHNAARGVKVVSSNRGKRRIQPIDKVLSDVQVAAIVEATDLRFHLFVKTLALTGMRSGEAMALWVEDLNLDDANGATIWVGASISRVGGMLRGSTKSGEGRHVAIRMDLARELAAHVDGMGPEDYVFTSATGQPIHYSNFRKRVWARAVESAREAVELPERVPMHELRHYYATSALVAGVPLVVVSKQLGHSSVSVTADMYARWTRQGSDDTAAAVAAGFAEGQRQLQRGDVGSGTTGTDGSGTTGTDGMRLPPEAII